VVYKPEIEANLEQGQFYLVLRWGNFNPITQSHVQIINETNRYINDWGQTVDSLPHRRHEINKLLRRRGLL
jgi:hypothetical protein